VGLGEPGTNMEKLEKKGKEERGKVFWGYGHKGLEESKRDREEMGNLGKVVLLVSGGGGGGARDRLGR